MKTILSLLTLLSLFNCGKNTEERCRGSEEMQMICQVEWAQEYHAYTIPDWVKKQCVNFYPSPGCYYDTSKRHYW